MMKLNNYCTITYKYKPGQTVFFLNKTSVPKMSICYVCLGEGHLFTVSGEKVRCLKCYGKKEIAMGIKNTLFEVFSSEIRMVDIFIQENKETKLYYIEPIKDNCLHSEDLLYESNPNHQMEHQCPYKLFENEIYETLKDAKEARDKENSKLNE